MHRSTLFRGLAAAALSLAFVVAPARVAAHESWWTETLGTPTCDSAIIEVTGFTYDAAGGGFLATDSGLLFGYALHEGVTIENGALLNADGVVTPIPTKVAFDTCVVELVKEQIAVTIVGATREVPPVTAPGAPTETIDCPAPNVDPATGLITIPEGAPSDCMYPMTVVPMPIENEADPCAPDANGVVSEMCQTIVVDAPVETRAVSGSGDLINPIAALAVAFGVGLFAYLRRRRA